MITCYNFARGLGTNSTLIVNKVNIIDKVKEAINSTINLGTSSNNEPELIASNWKPALWISIGTAATLLALQTYRVGLFPNRLRPNTESELENYIP